ncbi:MAG: PKD domain-containing protein [Planctomycetota bacterium]
MFALKFARICALCLPVLLLASGACTKDDSDPPPASATADFSASPVVGTAPLLVTFTSLATGDYDSLAWCFGDGTEATHPFPTHTYLNPGTYTVTLTLYRANSIVASEAKTGYITVNPVTAGPQADFSASATSVSVGTAITFTDLSTGSISSWAWSFGDTTTSSAQNPTHTYTAGGVYTVSLTVNGPNGSDTETKLNYITVGTPAPVADFTSDVRMGNPPLTVNFQDLSTGGVTSWSWNFGDGGTSALQNPQHIYTGPQGAQYTVTLTVIGPGGTDAETKTNYIWLMTPPPPPKPVIYLYPETPRTETVKLEFTGYATITIPRIPLGPEIVWEDLWVEDGTIYFQGRPFPYLFYESVILWPITSHRGWILERDLKGRLFLDGKEISWPRLADFYESELRRAGLYDHEIADFMDYWFGPEERVFFARDMFTFAVRYFPIDQLDRLMKLTTANPYESIVRIMYYVEEVPRGTQMLRPVYAPVQPGPSVLHEWGYIPSGELNKGNWR